MAGHRSSLSGDTITKVRRLYDAESVYQVDFYSRDIYDFIENDGSYKGFLSQFVDQVAGCRRFAATTEAISGIDVGPFGVLDDEELILDGLYMAFCRVTVFDGVYKTEDGDGPACRPRQIQRGGESMSDKDDKANAADGKVRTQCPFRGDISTEGIGVGPRGPDMGRVDTGARSGQGAGARRVRGDPLDGPRDRARRVRSGGEAIRENPARVRRVYARGDVIVNLVDGALGNLPRGADGVHLKVVLPKEVSPTGSIEVSIVPRGEGDSRFRRSARGDRNVLWRIQQGQKADAAKALLLPS